MFLKTRNLATHPPQQPPNKTQTTNQSKHTNTTQTQIFYAPEIGEPRAFSRLGRRPLSCGQTPLHVLAFFLYNSPTTQAAGRRILLFTLDCLFILILYTHHRPTPSLFSKRLHTQIFVLYSLFSSIIFSSTRQHLFSIGQPRCMPSTHFR